MQLRMFVNFSKTTTVMTVEVFFLNNYFSFIHSNSGTALSTHFTSKQSNCLYKVQCVM